ncbi:MAG: LysR family transcriptional regulator [Variovorax sp.]|nr:MAG: LysR family transcriptional regulator [Variovorax sp.]
MNLRSLDLNLLLIFDAVYNERSISKAARKLHLSQPTVSNALGRLRDRLQDPLFERSSQGMSPTVRSKALAEPIRQALAVLERGLRGDDAFDFPHSDREFVVAVEDYGEAIILPRFVDWLAKFAPGIRIRIRPEPFSQLKGEMRDGAVDLALDYFAPHDPAFRHKAALTEDLLSLSRRDNPHVGEKLSLETYLALRHVVLAPSTSAMPMIDLALSKRDLQRQIAVTVPHFLSMPLLVQSSDLICTLPRRMAHLYADHFRLKSHEVPLRIPRFPVYFIWHRAAEEDASHTWLRNQLLECCQRL